MNIFCRFSDAVLLFKNDMVSGHCRGEGHSQPAISYNQMNKYIANCLAGVVLPTDTLTPTKLVKLKCLFLNSLCKKYLQLGTVIVKFKRDVS